MKKYLLVFGFGVLLSVLCAQSTFATSYNTISQSMLSLLTLKSLDVNLHATSTMYPGSSSSMLLPSSGTHTFTIDIDAKQDISTPGSLKAIHQFSSTTNNPDLPAAFANINFEDRIDGDTVYIKIPSQLFTLLSIPMVGTTDNWVRISPADIEALKKDYPFLGQLHDALASTNTQPVAVIKAHQTDWLRFTQALQARYISTKTIDGARVRIYSFTLNKTLLKNAIIAYMKSISTTGSITNVQLNDIDSSLASFRVKNGYFLINADSKLPVAVSAIVDSYAPYTTKVSNSTDFKISFKDFNVPVVITPPTPFLSALDAFNQWFKPSLDAAKLKDSVASVKGNMSNIRALAELIYNTNNSQFGSVANNGSCGAPIAGSLFSGVGQNAADIKNVIDAITKAGATDMRCNSTSQAFAMSAKLPSSNMYFCVDSTGTAQEQLLQISGTSCR